MLRSLYKFQPDNPASGVLSCKENDHFCAVEFDNSGQWVKVVDEHGAAGFLPLNYMEYCTWTNDESLLKFLDRSLTIVYNEGADRCSYSGHQREYIKVMSELRTRIGEDYRNYIISIENVMNGKSQNKSTTGIQNNNSQPVAATVKQDDTKTEPPSAAAVKLQSQPETPNTDQTTETSHPNPGVVAISLVDDLRRSTSLSFTVAKQSVTDIIDKLINLNMDISLLREMSHALNDTQIEEMVVGDQGTDSEDVREFKDILSNIQECKDDSQQRSWHLHDDLEYVRVRLKRLLDILSSASEYQMRRLLSSDKELYINTLVEYYQMESRNVLRLELLQIFTVISYLDNQLTSFLLSTVLPVELVTDMKSCQDVDRLRYSGILLAGLFSICEPIPTNQNVVFNTDFFDWLVDTVENSDDDTAKILVEVLLSINQQYTLSDKPSPIIESLSNVDELSVLTEVIISHLNRGDDPAAPHTPTEDNSEHRVNSVLKFCIDIYSWEIASTLLYTNDLKLLVDISVRNVSDVGCTDPVRTDYLHLLYNIILNSQYKEQKHRLADITAVINQIEFEEEGHGDQAEKDVNWCQKIREALK